MNMIFRKTPLKISPGEKAFSFIEMIVAITILMFAITFIMTIVSSNNAEREKVLNYYVAMSIANKIAEDIDNTIRENPYFLSEISTYNKSYKILSTDSPFFMSIEDFNLDGKLNDDIKNYSSVFDLKKVENFEYSISAKEIEGHEGLSEHIARVTITVKWPDGQKNKDYSFSTIFSGVPIVCASSEPEFEATVTPGVVASLKTALNSPSTDFKAFAESLGDDYESLYNLGLLSVFTEAVKERVQKIDIEIQNLKSSPQHDLYSKIALAGLYEKKSILLMQNLNYIKFPASALLKRLKDGAYKIDGFSAANQPRVQKIKTNIGLLRKTDPLTNSPVAASFVNMFSDSLHSAFLIYLSLLSEPSVESKLNLRERQSVFLKIIDLGSAMILNRNESVIVNIGNYPLSVKQTVKNTLRNLQLYYDLRNIARSKFVGLLFEKVNLGLKLPAEEELEKKYDDMTTLAKFCERLYTML
ncbi:MAG: hypothetical protein A2008_07810 [Candidatus Wallbacteria bacterium GWC2_49_35]|uniref:Prepilin-type N-terminal cleavage/methylation domain-containing protein n=1 Tax=Candidatus Wallbacteria bacterium GWC2_49_35 TaxID=1817813 RepID=A0A1F7WD49_9BACT|nr:MAG: hypothetical protein A2008_07810 [Candidatus Wallbacteria bacterium GWC2_49_35]